PRGGGRTEGRARGRGAARVSGGRRSVGGRGGPGRGPPRKQMSARARGVDLIVKGGHVVTASDVVDASVAIKGGRIVALAPEEFLPPADRVIDATGKLVFPGLIDCHLHV